MKTLLFFKRLDLALQICAFAIPLAVCIWQEPDGGFVSIYFCVGGVQVLSFFSHLLVSRSDWTARGRRTYGQLLGFILIVVVTMVASDWIWGGTRDAIIVGLYFSILFTPAMAVWYFTVCLREMRRVAQTARREMLIVRNV